MLGCSEKHFFFLNLKIQAIKSCFILNKKNTKFQIFQNIPLRSITVPKFHKTKKIDYFNII